MSDIIDISSWTPQRWYNTGGTRDKKYILSTDGNFYYFKKSIKKGVKDYISEFWCEVMAYRIGITLGFDILKYEPAILNGEMGCLCRTMIDSETEELVEGGKYLQACENRFNPKIKDWKKMYTFQLIEKAFETFQLTEYVNYVLEFLVFDSIIGNGDRHQENWALITQMTPITKGIKALSDEVKERPAGKRAALWQRFIEYFYFDKDRQLKPEVIAAKISLEKVKGASPVYDNGSSMGRELTEDRIIQYSANEPELIKYIKNGYSEIHWNTEKLNHFDLLSELLKTKYREALIKIINRVKTKWDPAVIEKIITEVDNFVPESLSHYNLTSQRKIFIIKLLTLRFQRLNSLLGEGI